MVESSLTALKPNLVDQHTSITLHYIMHSQDYETLKYEQKIYAILEKLRTEANLKIKLLTCLGAND